MLTQLTDHIYISDFDTSNDRPRLAYIKGSRFNVMIDAGNSPAHFELFLSECHELGLKDPDYILLTHWHWDHTYGLANTKIPAICSDLTQLKLEEMSRWKWTDEAMKNRLANGEDIEFCDENLRIEYRDISTIKVRSADITFTHKLTIDCGDISCVMLLVDNDHSIDSSIIFVPEEKTLFLGDIISEDYHHGEPHYTKEKFYALWNHLQSYDFDFAIHGHTEVFNKQTLNEFFNESKELVKEAN